MPKRIATRACVYWDKRNDRWSYRLSDDRGDFECGAIVGVPDDDLVAAVELACHELDLPAIADDFCMSSDDGGCADWDKEGAI